MRNLKDNLIIKTLVNFARYQNGKFQDEKSRKVLTLAFGKTREELDQLLDGALCNDDVDMVNLYLDAININYDYSIITQVLHKEDIKELVRFTKGELSA